MNSAIFAAAAHESRSVPWNAANRCGLPANVPRPVGRLTDLPASRLATRVIRRQACANRSHLPVSVFGFRGGRSKARASWRDTRVNRRQRHPC